jgi:hypothetical protein
MTSSRRFQDDGRRLYDFAYLFLVQCPRCGKRAEVRPIPPKDPAAKAPTGYAEVFTPRRLACLHCGYTRETDNRVERNGRRVREIRPQEGKDWYFHRPLWLQAGCCGELLWAFNRDHLEYMEGFVGAGLREEAFPMYTNSTMMSRLPRWMKLARNREEVLGCIRKLKEGL